MGVQRSVIFLVAGATLLSSGLHGQQAVPTLAAAARTDSAETLQVTTNIVLVPVVVMDGSTNTSRGCQRTTSSCTTIACGRISATSHRKTFRCRRTLLLDTSGSMVRTLAMASMAAREFLMASNPEDEFSLIQFNDEPRLLETFTEDHGKIAKWLPFFEPHGWTALLDSIDLAVEEMRYARKALFIISDGCENRSRHTATAVLRRVTEADVQVYSIGIFSSWKEQSGATLLRTTAGVIGGRLFKVDDPNVLPETAKTIGAAPRNQYVLGSVFFGMNRRLPTGIPGT